MKVYHELNHPHVIAALKAGGVGVIPTDTVYGIVASAHHPAAVERLYTLRHRDPAKACIMLIADAQQIAAWVHFPPREASDAYWPGPVSIVLPAFEQTPHYLHRGQKSLACRVPADSNLRQLLQKTGPLLAPSANLEGQPPATTVTEAQAYFGGRVDFYVDGGEKHAAPSKLIKIEAGKTVVLRG